jgi:transposase
VVWAPAAGRFTYAFEELAAYLAQITDKTQVKRLLGIAWETVGSIVERVVERRLDAERLVGLRRIGIDEFSYKKRHNYWVFRFLCG